MKIIEGMKEIKRLQNKLGDLTVKIKTHCADLDFENPVYQNQEAQVREWLQSYSDTLKRILDLRLAIQTTNLSTDVVIKLGETHVTKTIAAWIHRRRDLAGLEMQIWQTLTDGTRKDGVMMTSSGEKKDVRVRRYYQPQERDQKVALYRDEPSIIDGTLEVVNAVTDLIGV